MAVWRFQRHPEPHLRTQTEKMERQLQKNPIYTERGTEDRHWMSSIDHLHTEAEMLKVREHSELLSAQYLGRCLEPGNVCHPITKRATPERQMKETLYTRHRDTVEPMMVKMIGKLHSKHSILMQSIRLLSVTRGMWC